VLCLFFSIECVGLLHVDDSGGVSSFERGGGITQIAEILLMLFGQFVFLVLFELDASADDREEDDEGQIEVEPAGDAGRIAILERVDESELVGVTSSVEGDATDEKVGSREGSGQNNHGVVATEGETSTN